ncbi:acyl-CoA dehydrogenase family protein [Novosphingobium sp. MMS21-SN21R]|uniref:acyl-CoA dehydrogenase family protein n=1 Tax=Novosphingobium sp. MMS21-SN21R TaxID=2969298 RepID=UPI0028858949|nr:acyl-CoA dehydrogenase family protein [Novosphingobium sp. MMS21-SN21R]MDT0507024.1 acyl-CoA dehydrogenase family protein [Novosphingobium sp. MMS21-SN21R]
MRAANPAPDLARTGRQIELSYRIAEVRLARESWAAATADTCLAVLDGADKFARDVLEPLNIAMDRGGCVLVDGRVATASGHQSAWKEYVEAGWPTLEAAEEHGGQGLPAILAFAAQELFDRACPAFGMLPVPQRSAFRLIDAYGTQGMRAEWLPRLASGEWGATICVSEVGAGSDLARVSTHAEPNDDGTWSVTGEKCWISYGDHDLTDQIGHAVLAQTVGPEGKKRPSLFLVPTLLPGGSRNSVAVRRLEHKLGLHGSPTCALGFEGATGWLLGEPGRGLAQLFVMIANMRLAVGAMGLGIASASADVALAYASERKQGGRPDPLPINQHADVRLQLLNALAPPTLLRGLLFAVANANDLAAHGDSEAAALAAWLLPIVKTTGGEVAFDVSGGAIQVLGGAGYTNEWPAEQALRDARVLTIFEGATGIQALDLTHRRLLADDSSYQVFLGIAGRCAEERLKACLSELQQAADWLKANPTKADSGATAFLHLAAISALSWIAAHYTENGTDDAVLTVAAEHWLDTVTAKAAALRLQIIMGADLVDRFSAL